MSHATENPVYCARKNDLGCTASHPSGRWGNQNAANEGWFASRAEGVSYCPAHLPDWVPAWREKQEKNKFEVQGTYDDRSAELVCLGCDLREPVLVNPGAEALKAMRARAFEHGRETGHVVTVAAEHVLTVEPVS